MRCSAAMTRCTAAAVSTSGASTTQKRLQQVAGASRRRGGRKARLTAPRAPSAVYGNGEGGSDDPRRRPALPPEGEDPWEGEGVGILVTVGAGAAVVAALALVVTLAKPIVTTMGDSFPAPFEAAQSLTSGTDDEEDVGDGDQGSAFDFFSIERGESVGNELDATVAGPGGETSTPPKGPDETLGGELLRDDNVDLFGSPQSGGTDEMFSGDWRRRREMTIITDVMRS